MRPDQRARPGLARGDAANGGCAGTGRPKPVLEIVVEDSRWAEFGIEALASRAVASVVARLDIPGVPEVSLLASDDTRVARLNGRFRGRETPTNVLSWPAADLSPSRPGDRPRAPVPGRTESLPDSTDVTEVPTARGPFLGDIAIAWETCEREAREQDKPLEDHVAHLIVHGTLHLLGYDHQNDTDADLIEGLEAEILCNMGVPDPYSA